MDIRNTTYTSDNKRFETYISDGNVLLENDQKYNGYTKVRIKYCIHKGEQRLKMVFDYNKALIDTVRSAPGRKWSSTMQCWHLPVDRTSFKWLENWAWERNDREMSDDLTRIRKLLHHKHLLKKATDNEKVREAIKTFEAWLRSTRYSEKTIVTYTEALKTFFGFMAEKDPDEITNEDVEYFNFKYIIGNKFSFSYQNQVINAIKLYYKIHQKKKIEIEEIKRPRRGRKLPEILSPQEVERLLKSTFNIKHKAMLSLIYACGLRRSELLNLRINSIDTDRSLLIIKSAKGNKDRVAPLPKSIYEMLRQYYKQYKPRNWMFEGQKEGEQYTESSIQNVFQQCRAKAGIKKYVTLHTLRHSYATHLLENGVDLRYIQEILGHKSSRTTEIYTHVTKKSIENIKSPFENLNLD